MTAKKKRQSCDELGLPYVPASESCNSLKVDVPDSMATEMFEALDRVKKAVGGNINEFVADRLHMTEIELCRVLAAEQIDAVALAIYNIEAYGEALIIGDQTGIGKGRQAAAMIRYSYYRGIKSISITEKPNLFSSTYRDLEAIGSGHLVPFIVNGKESKTDVKDEDGNIIYQAPEKSAQKKIFESGNVTGYDYIMLTYSQLQDSDEQSVKKQFLRKIAEGSIIVMDESHNASGESNVGVFLQDILSLSTGVVFLSATFAKRPDNMPIYAMKTAISEANMTKEDLVNAISKGGVALQEILSSQLVKEGQMIRRERTYEGIEVNYLTLFDLEPKHKAIADNITAIIRDIISFQKYYVEPVIDEMDEVAAEEAKVIKQRGGTSKAGIDNQPYFSKVFNVINQMLFSIKASAVADHAIMRLKQGKKPVIAFSSTMETFIKEIGAEPGQTINADFSLVLQKGLDGVLRYTERDEKGNPTFKSFSLDELSVDARKEYYEIQDKINKVSTGISISPIDVIKQRLQNAGYSVAEVTGRDMELQLNDVESLGYLTSKKIQGLVMNRKRIRTNDAFRMFNNNEVDVLMINQAGSTGESAHAVTTKKVSKDQVKQRVMIGLQPEQDINKEVQKRGRVNRSFQIFLPIYDYISSAIPAERRLMMMQQQKLKSLDANTTSNQKQSSSILDVPDFLNKIGDRCVKEFLMENEDINDLLGDPLFLNEHSDQENRDRIVEDAAMKTSGRVAILSTKMQEKFYNDVIARYNKRVDYLKQVDEYDLEVEILDLQAETKSKDIYKIGKGGRTSFGEDSILEKIEANVLKKPYKKLEVDKMIKAELGGKSPNVIQDNLIKNYQDFVAKRLQDDITDINEHYKKLIKEIPNEKKIQKITNKAERNEAIQLRVQELENANREKVAIARNKASSQVDYMLMFFSQFIVGRGYNYPVPSWEGTTAYTKAIFLGVSIDEKRNNPYAPSAVEFKFALADSNKYIALVASGEMGEKLRSIIGSSVNLTDQQREEILINWDSLIKESSASRKTRYMITGNLLQAFDSGKGKLVSYTTKKKNELRKGILMPDNWRPLEMQGKESRITIPIAAAAKLIKGISPGTFINTTTGISITSNSSGFYIIYVPASRKQGGDIYLDKDILELVYNNIFEKASDKMKAMVPYQKIDKLLEILQEKHNVSVNVNTNLYEHIKADIKKFQKENSKERIVYLKLNKPVIKQDDSLNILELEAEALELELQLLSF